MSLNLRNIESVQYIRASKLHEFVAATYAEEYGPWPFPRSILKGLRLRQVLDGIKMHMATLYIETRTGSFPHEEYSGMKGRWSFMLVSLPIVFARNDVYAKYEHLPPAERKMRLMMVGNDWILNPGEMDEEELEYYEDPENLDSFLGYVEKMAKHAKHPFDHVLGHLSRGVIYVDDRIPIISK